MIVPQKNKMNQARTGQGERNRENRLLLLLIISTYILFSIAFSMKGTFADESSWVKNSKSMTLDKEFPHPPLAQYVFKTAYQINHNLRLVPLFLNLISVLIIYYFLKSEYTKEVALIAAFLCATTFWFIYASTQIDMNGAILNLFFLVGAIILLKVNNKYFWKKSILVGIVLAFIIYTKYSEFLLFSLIYLLWVLLEKSLDAKSKIGFLISSFSVCIALFLIYPLSLYLSGNFSTFMMTISHLGGSWGLTLRPMLVILTYGLMLVFFAVLSDKSRRDEKLFFIWIMATLLFYFLLIGKKVLTYERYFTIMLFPAIMLGAILLGRTGYFKEHKKRAAEIAGFYALFILINLRSVSYIPHDVGQYLKNALTLNFAFNIPLTGSSGPFFYINFESLALLFIASAISFAAYLVSKKYRPHNSRKMLFILFSLNLAFNLFLITEQGFGLTHPDYEAVVSEVKEYFIEQNLPKPVYYSGWQGGMIADLGINESYDIPQFEKERIAGMIAGKKGTAIIIDFPKINDGDERISLIKEKCSINKTFSDKGIEMGKVYLC